MEKERRCDSLLKRFPWPVSTFFLCAALATNLAIVTPGSARADSKDLKAVVDDLLKRLAALEDQVATLETRQIVLRGELDQHRGIIEAVRSDLKEESKRAQMAELEAEQEMERQASMDRYITAVVGAALVIAEAGGGQSAPPSESALYNAKLILGNAILESIQTGDYIFLEGPASNAIDTDGDGIPDGIDFCPYTYGTLTLMGCPVQYND